MTATPTTATVHESRWETAAERLARKAARTQAKSLSSTCTHVQSPAVQAAVVPVVVGGVKDIAHTTPPPVDQHPVCVRNGRAKCSRCKATGAGIRHLDEVLCTDCYDAAEEAAAMAQREVGQTPAQAAEELARYEAALAEVPHCVHCGLLQSAWAGTTCCEGDTHADAYYCEGCECRMDYPGTCMTCEQDDAFCRSGLSTGVSEEDRSMLLYQLKHTSGATMRGPGAGFDRTAAESMLARMGDNRSQWRVEVCS